MPFTRGCLIYSNALCAMVNLVPFLAHATFTIFTSWSGHLVLGTRAHNVAVMLKEIQMPPLLFLEIMGFAHTATNRTWKFCSPVGLDSYLQLVRIYTRIKELPYDPPGSLYPQLQGYYSPFIVLPSYLFPVDLNCTIQIHRKRRRANFSRNSQWRKEKETLER